MTTIVFIVVAAGLFYLWWSGYAELILFRFGVQIGRGAKWVSDEGGAWVSLVEQLPHRDFVEEDDVVETEDGWLWAGLALRAIPTDGFAGAEWNSLLAKLNRVLSSQEDKTWVQIVTCVDNDVSGGCEVFERIAASSPDDCVRAIIRARAQHLRLEGQRGNVTTPRTYAFLGRRKELLRQKLPLSSVVSTSPLVDLEEQDFLELRGEVLQAREAFAEAFRAAGGLSSPLTSDQVFALVFDPLNPGRSAEHPVPRPRFSPNKLGVAYQRAVQPQPVTLFAAGDARGEGAAAGGEWDDFITGLEEEGVVEAGPGAPDQADAAPHAPVLVSQPTMWVTGAGLFAESPRERLCREPVEVRKDHFRVGERDVAVVSLQQLPGLTYAGLSEKLTRHPKANFPFRVVTSFEVGDRYEWDNNLAKKSERLALNLEAKRPDQVEAMSADEVKALRADLRSGNMKIGRFGLNIAVEGSDYEQLKRRRTVVMGALREMEDMEGTVEKHLPLPQLVATLPCAPHADKRRKAALSRDVVGLLTLTGAASGPVGPEGAMHVYETADGRLLYWHPFAPGFPSGWSVVAGAAGSGKSGHMNLQRTYWRAAGYQLLTIEFGASSYRVCKGLGGTFIDVCDAGRSYKFGLFDIRVKPGEKFKPEELTPEGLPKKRLAEVENLLEQLCLDIRKPNDFLAHRLANFLRQSVRRTYRRLVDTTPRLDDFIKTLSDALRQEREMAEELLARLEIYASDGSLGRFLNESSDAEEIDIASPYIVFNLNAAKDDPRLMLVSTLAVNSWVRRFIQQDRRIKKGLDIDEFHVVSKLQLICEMIDETIRTARKCNVIGSVASQSAGDFRDSEKNPAAAAIRDNCETKWIFRTPNPAVVAEVFQLKPGVAALVSELQMHASDDWRDCVLLWPGGGCAHLRLRHGKVDKRLLLGATGKEEKVSADEAVQLAAAALSAPVPARLREALSADALGAPVAV